MFELNTRFFLLRLLVCLTPELYGAISCRSEFKQFKLGLIRPIDETDTETKIKHKDEKMSNWVKIVSCLIEISSNESLTSQDRDQDF